MCDVMNSNAKCSIKFIVFISYLWGTSVGGGGADLFSIPILCIYTLEIQACPPRVGAGRSSEVERSLMVRWVVRSILHGVDPLSYFSFQPVLHDWCNKGRGMCYPVCGMMYIKEPLSPIGKSSPCGGSGFPLSHLSVPLPYVRRHITVNKMC